jgi:tRNA (guanosine-2'-O-)-methyltransferase
MKGDRSIFSDLPAEEQQNLLRFFETYITDHKVSEIERVLSNRTRAITVAVEDPDKTFNASAIVRSAEAFGLQDLYLSSSNNRTVANEYVTRGAGRWIDVYPYTKSDRDNAKDLIDDLRAKGYRIVATVPEAQKREGYILPDYPLEHKMALFFGTENEGLSKIILDNADEYLQIPVYGFTESYNVSAAAAIILSHVVPALHQSAIDWRLPEQERLALKYSWYRKLLRHPDQYEKVFYEQS